VGGVKNITRIRPRWPCRFIRLYKRHSFILKGHKISDVYKRPFDIVSYDCRINKNNNNVNVSVCNGEFHQFRAVYDFERRLCRHSVTRTHVTCANFTTRLLIYTICATRKSYMRTFLAWGCRNSSGVTECPKSPKRVSLSPFLYEYTRKI